MRHEIQGREPCQNLKRVEISIQMPYNALKSISRAVPTQWESAYNEYPQSRFPNMHCNSKYLN